MPWRKARLCHPPGSIQRSLMDAAFWPHRNLTCAVQTQANVVNARRLSITPQLIIGWPAGSHDMHTAHLIAGPNEPASGDNQIFTGALACKLRDHRRIARASGHLESLAVLKEGYAGFERSGRCRDDCHCSPRRDAIDTHGCQGHEDDGDHDRADDELHVRSLMALPTVASAVDRRSARDRKRRYDWRR